MGPTAASGYQVDRDALRQCGATVKSISDDVTSVRRQIAATPMLSEEGVGGSGVVEALRRFHDAWREELTVDRDALGEASANLTNSANDYDRADRINEAAFQAVGSGAGWSASSIAPAGR